MDLKKFKLGVGPMSPVITELCLKYSFMHNFPLLFVCSRNQVDYDNGYSFTTSNLITSIKNSDYYVHENILICRDHCGPFFSDMDFGLSTTQALERCYETIQTDLYNGVDLIHIDVSRVEPSHQLKTAERLFDFAIKLNPNIIFEFGSEDNNGNINKNKQYYLNQLDFITDYKPYVKYFVAQTGSLTKHKQVGTFNFDFTKQIVELVHQYGFLFKEHNADYLTKNDIQLRINAGIDCLNIAPQLGVIHSKSLLQLKNAAIFEFNNFYEFVLKQDNYKKWVTNDVTDDVTKFLVSAHYFFHSKLGKLLHEKLNPVELTNLIEELLNAGLDEYRLGYEKI